MKTDAGKCLFVCLCLLVVASRSRFHERARRTLAGKVNEPFGKKTSGNDGDDTATTPRRTERPDRDESPQRRCRGGNGDEGLHPLFGVDWKTVGTEIANNWWIIAVSSLLPFVLLWRVQYNMGKRIVGWKKSLAGKEKPFARHSRRLTLPDLTLARHARRESMAEAAHRLTVSGRPRKLSQCNVSQFRSTKKSSFERNDSPGDTKRVHYIIRRGN